MNNSYPTLAKEFTQGSVKWVNNTIGDAEMLALLGTIIVIVASYMVYKYGKKR